MNRRQKIIISVTGIFLVLLILVGLTYAYFLTQIEGNEEEKSITVTTAKLELVYSDNTPEIDLSAIIPITTDKVKTEGLVKSFTISKTTESADVYTTIKLNNLNVSENIALYDLKWALYQGDNPISTGDFGGKTTGEIVLATNQLINSTAGLEYSLHIWINETGIDQSDMMNGTLSAMLDITGVDKPINTLSSLILGDNNVNVTTTAPTYTYGSTDRGLFEQSGDVERSEMGFPTYYFKGSSSSTTINTDYVMNSYVSFGTYQTTDGGNTVAEPIIWKVVRINEDGSIRLISENGIATNIVWNSIGVANYINEDGTDSEAKNTVETWYNNNIGNNITLDNKVVQSSFCNDISGDYTAAIARISKNTPNPIFICPTEAITVYSKAGLITADELVYGGAIDTALMQGPSTNAYLGFSPVFSMTPAEENRIAQIRVVGSAYSYIDHGLVNSSDFYENVYYHAVINLKSDVIVTGGDGLSSETAYVIE